MDPFHSLDILKNHFASVVFCRNSGVYNVQNSLYKCRLVRRTPYVCSHVEDGSVLIVAVKECIIVSVSVSPPRQLLGVCSHLVLCCCFLGAEWSNLLCVCAGSGGLLSCFFLLVLSLERTVE